MVSWVSVFRCWNVVVSVVVSAEVSADLTYTVHRTVLSFPQAVDWCSPATLTPLATQQEVSAVLRSISAAVPPGQRHFTFWVGLRKLKNECVIPTLPLRGFTWMEGGGEEAQVSRWREEPEETCTSVRCAAITGQVTGSSVTDWGLVPVSCTNRYQFICKHREGQGVGPEDPAPETTAPSTHRVTPEPQSTNTGHETNVTESQPPPTDAKDPETPGSTPKGPGLPVDPPTPGPEPKLPTPEPEDEFKPDRDLGPNPRPNPNPRPPSGPESCTNPIINGSRILVPDPDNSSRMGVDCFSGVRLELLCRDSVWWLWDEPLNTSAACWPCRTGYRKDIHGNCQDVDECVVGPAPCRHTCVNTQGSFRCVCSTGEEGEGSECTTALSGTLLQVLVPLGVLVLLLVLLGVSVKCCLRRRSLNKSEKMNMKENSSKESRETTNQRTGL